VAEDSRGSVLPYFDSLHSILTLHQERHLSHLAVSGEIDNRFTLPRTLGVSAYVVRELIHQRAIRDGEEDDEVSIRSKQNKKTLLEEELEEDKNFLKRPKTSDGMIVEMLNVVEEESSSDEEEEEGSIEYDALGFPKTPKAKKKKKKKKVTNLPSRRFKYSQELRESMRLENEKALATEDDNEDHHIPGLRGISMNDLKNAFPEAFSSSSHGPKVYLRDGKGSSLPVPFQLQYKSHEVKHPGHTVIRFTTPKRGSENYKPTKRDRKKNSKMYSKRTIEI